MSNPKTDGDEVRRVNAMRHAYIHAVYCDVVVEEVHKLISEAHLAHFRSSNDSAPELEITPKMPTDMNKNIWARHANNQ